MKFTRRILRDMITEEMRVLSEGANRGSTSLDDQIDALLASYEEGSIEQIDYESAGITDESFKLQKVMNFLFEAPEDEEEEGDEGDDEPAEDDPEAEEGEEGEEPVEDDPEAELQKMVGQISGAGFEVSKTVDNSGRDEPVEADVEVGGVRPPLNISSFTDSVNNLVTNYDNLLDIPSVIIQRTTEFLTNKYGLEVSDEFEEKLRLDFGTEQIDHDPDPGDIPLAVGAGPAGGGA